MQKKRLEDRDEMTDEFDVYGKYVGSELRNIKDEYSTLIAKQFINNILIDARIGKYRQEYNTYGYNTGRQITPGTSASNVVPQTRTVFNKIMMKMLLILNYVISYQIYKINPRLRDSKSLKD